MNHPEPHVSKPSKHNHLNAQNDIQICTACVTLMRSTAEKCRDWSAESTSSTCKGGLDTSAFVCDALAGSMEACMRLMGVDANETTRGSDMKEDCCS